MKIFTRLYDLALQWSKHPHAPRYLAGLSFAESSFFPVPVDVMLAPMALAKPDKAWRFALIASVASVAGGVMGFLIGYFAIDMILPILEKLGYMKSYESAVSWFNEWGLIAVFVAGFSPIPYKVFTITAGALSMMLLPFILISLVARGARFYLVAGVMVWGGEKMEAGLRRYMDIMGWAVVFIAVILYIFVKNH